MSKLAGRWLKVYIDDAGLTAREVSSDVESVDIDDNYGELDVTGFSDGSENSIPGMPSFNVEMTCHFNPAATTGIYTVLNAIIGDYAGHTVTIQQGQNTTPTNGDPEFEGEYWLQSMKFSSDPKGKTTLTASFRVYGSTAPAWGTVSA
ncbi:MAG: hypothetical protein JW908_00545 [Anaerolineales bacterium]|nr:hypothetical protein [Anaerolineales bacterium]